MKRKLRPLFNFILGHTNKTATKIEPKHLHLQWSVFNYGNAQLHQSIVQNRILTRLYPLLRFSLRQLILAFACAIPLIVMFKQMSIHTHTSYFPFQYYYLKAEWDRRHFRNVEMTAFNLIYVILLNEHQKRSPFFCSCLFISNLQNGKRKREQGKYRPVHHAQIQYNEYFQHFIHQTAKCNQSKKFCRSFRLAEHDDDTIRQSEHVPVSVLISFIYKYILRFTSRSFFANMQRKRADDGFRFVRSQDSSAKFLLNGIKVFHANPILSSICK